MKPDPIKVALRYNIRLAARQVVSQPVRVHTASANTVRREITAEVLEALGEAALFNTKLAFNLTAKLKQLWEMFQKAPKAWEDFKEMLGIKADGVIALLKELPQRIRDMLKKAEAYLMQMGKQLSKIPIVRLYLDLSAKMPAVGKLLNKIEPHRFNVLCVQCFPRYIPSGNS